MRSQLIVGFVVEAFYSRVLDCSVHPLDLPIGPRVVGLGQPVLDPVGFADHIEAHRPGIDGVAVPRLLCELNAVIGENGVDLIGHSVEQMLQELPGRLSVSRCNELSDGELGRSVNAYKEIELAFGRLHLCDVDMEEPYGVALELLSLGLVAFAIRQARDAVSLKAPMKRRPRQMRDRWLQSIEAIVQRQQRVAPECHNHRLLGLGQHR